MKIVKVRITPFIKDMGITIKNAVKLKYFYMDHGIILMKKDHGIENISRLWRVK